MLELSEIVKQKQLSVVLDGRGGTFAQNGEKNSILFPYFGQHLEMQPVIN